MAGQAKQKETERRQRQQRPFMVRCGCRALRVLFALSFIVCRLVLLVPYVYMVQVSILGAFASASQYSYLQLGVFVAMEAVCVVLSLLQVRAAPALPTHRLTRGFFF